MPELPEGINIPMIELIHSGKDSYIPFMGKNSAGELKNLFSLRRDQLRSYFPEMMKWLVQDSYMGVNSYYRPAIYPNKTTGLPDVWRKEFNLKYLNAVYADLDVGRSDSKIKEQRIPWIEAQHKVEYLMAQGKLPQASIYAPSGRGLYLIWLIRDPQDPNLPQKAWPEKLQLYKNINRSLTFKLRKLAADQKAIDGARVLKTPGTIDSKSGNQVRYFIRVGDQGLPFIHTLEGLAAALQTGSHEKELPAGGYAIPFYDIRAVKVKGKYPKRIEGFKKRCFNRVQDLGKIETWLQGFPEGKRRRSLTLLGECLKFSGADEARIRSVLESKAERCRPPYPSAGDTSLEVIIKNIWQGQARLSRSGSAALCREYGITREIALYLELQSIMPADLKTELEAEEKAQLKAERAASKADKLAALKRILEGSGKGFGLRKIAAALTDSGFPMSHQQVKRLKVQIRRDKIGGKP